MRMQAEERYERRYTNLSICSGRDKELWPGPEDQVFYAGINAFGD
jgi:hypothetical protein